MERIKYLLPLFLVGFVFAQDDDDLDLDAMWDNTVWNEIEDIADEDIQEVDNAVNNTQREVTTRYDFRGSNSEINFDRKEKNLTLITADEMKLEAFKEMLIGHIIKRGIDPKCLEFGDAEGNSKGQSRCKVIIQEGISREIAQKLVKRIRGTKIKVQPQKDLRFDKRQ